MRAYSRENPSPRYQKLLGMYKGLHEHGAMTENIPADETFDGRSLAPHVDTIKGGIERFRVKTLLDYGCGKAQAYERALLTLPNGKILKGLKEIWGLKKVSFYDPGYEPFSTLPTGVFYGVICTDVMEHCPEEDLEWIMSELFNFSRKFLFCTIACYPARKTLPNGENAHITLESPGWWLDKFEAAAKKNDQVRYLLWIDYEHGGRHLTVQG